MKLKTSLFLTVLAAAALTTGCGRDSSTTSTDATNPPVTGQELKAKYQDAAAASRDYAVQGKDEPVAAAAKKLKDLDAKLDALSARAADLKDDAKARADEALAAVREERNLAAAKYAELKAAGQDTWEKAKTGFAEAWTNVETAYENAKAKFN